MGRRFNQKERGVVRKRKRSTVFIVAEGHNRTEKNYFRGFVAKHKNLTFKIVHDSSTDPERMAQSLADFMDEMDYSAEDGDMAFCLIDHDCNQTKDEQIQKALEIARKRGFDVIVSNPCFEVWFICHYTSTPRNYSSSKEVLKELEEYLPDYEKSDTDIYDRTEPNLQSAINNAKHLVQRCQEQGHSQFRFDFSPCTDMYLAIEKMLEASSKL